MRALSIIQPWAWLIVSGHKDIENRVWSTPLRGQIYIHASATKSRAEFESAIQMAQRIDPSIVIPSYAHLVRGAIIGTAVLQDCVGRSDSPWFVGPYGFVLAQARRWPDPVPLKGALGLYEVPDDLFCTHP